MSIIPIIILGGALLFSSKKRKTATKASAKEETKKLPSSRGTVFDGNNLPDVIEAKVGETFSISFPPVAVGFTRKLMASPPDNSVEHVGTEYDAGAGIGAYSIVFIFRGAKKGTGSLVFHEIEGRLEGKAAPSEIVEVQTKIS